MQIWLTTDTHFGHSKIIQWGRPNNFEDKILTALQQQTEHGDILIHLGDFCIGKDLFWHNQYIANLPGRKHWLLLGNHDKKSTSWYIAHGWDWVGRRKFCQNEALAATPSRNPAFMA